MRQAAPWTAFGTLAALALLATGCGPKPDTPAAAAAKPAAKGAPPQSRPVPVEVHPAAEQDLTFAIDTVGSLLANETIHVPARVAGVIESIAFVEGLEITPGKVLARVDPDRYRLGLERAQAAASEAEARVKLAQSMLDKRQKLRERDPGWVTEEELSNFSAVVDQSQAALLAAKAQLELARKDFNDSFVRAPSPGIIDRKLAETGQFVTAGTAIATIVDTARLKLAFKVAESEAVALGPDARVQFRLKGMPGKEYAATLYHIGAAADPSTRMVECLAWVDAKGAGLKPGFFADVHVETSGRRAVVVAQTAVLPTDKGFRAFVLKGEDGVEARSVRLGLYTRDGRVEVLDGIVAGETVVVRGAASLNPRSKVKVVATGPEEAGK